MTSIRHRVRGLFWQSSSIWKPPLRALRRRLSFVLYRLRHARHPAGLPPRVHERPRRRRSPPLEHPAIVVVPPGQGDHGPHDPRESLPGQTETSWTWAGSPDAVRATFCWTAPADLTALSPTHLESLLLAAVAENLDATIASWSPPLTADREPRLVRPRQDVRAALELLRLPAQPDGDGEILARAVPHVSEEVAGDDILAWPLAQVSGSYFLRGDIAPGSVVRSDIAVDLDEILSRLPEVDGPRTVLFLLPFLAIGGAERLLFDLLAGLGADERLLIVTTEPHRAALGQTLDRARRFTPYIYTLGDWLPRESHAGALRHLIRRYRVATLFSWNGTVLFYDLATELAERFPGLRLLNQLYNHRGGWIEHYTPRLGKVVARHVAVNRRIAEALKEHGVDEERIAVVHHGVDVPPLVGADERARRRDESRRALGLPTDQLVVGSFIRLHPQKRPFDILELARRLTGRGIHFLLAGGGPLDEAVDRELQERPIPHFTRLPMTRDVAPLYDAIDVCLLTSAYEGLPIFLLDGLARGLPCVATAVGEIPELLEGGGGVLVERPGDLAAFERGVLELLDDQHREEQGVRGRRTVEKRFNLELYRRSYVELLFPSPPVGDSGHERSRP